MVLNENKLITNISSQLGFLPILNETDTPLITKCKKLMGDTASAAGLRTLLSVLFMSFPNNIATAVYKYSIISSGTNANKNIFEIGI